MVSLKKVVDITNLYNQLACLQPEERGQYMMDNIMSIIIGVNPVWATNIPTPRTKEAIGEYTADFESFWNAYPKKLGKGGAYIAWKKLKNPISVLEKCLDALKWQKRNWATNDIKYTPNPETYITQQRWLDEPPVSVAQAAANAGGETFTDMNGIIRVRV